MSNKIALLLFTASVLLTSFAAVTIPQANALTKNTFDDSHTTARFGNSKVCGDHICAPGEHGKWTMAVSQSQRSSGKAMGEKHGEDVMHKLAGTTPEPKAMPGTEKMNTGMKMTGNATKGTK